MTKTVEVNRRGFLKSVIAAAMIQKIVPLVPRTDSNSKPTQTVYRRWVDATAEIESVTRLGDEYETWFPTGMIRFNLECDHYVRISVDEVQRSEAKGLYDRVPCYVCSAFEPERMAGDFAAFGKRAIRQDLKDGYSGNEAMERTIYKATGRHS